MAHSPLTSKRFALWVDVVPISQYTDALRWIVEQGIHVTDKGGDAIDVAAIYNFYRDFDAGAKASSPTFHVNEQDHMLILLAHPGVFFSPSFERG